MTPQSHQNLLLESHDGNGQVSSSSSSESSFQVSIKADFNRLKANRLHNYSLFISAHVWSPSLVSLRRGVCSLNLLAYLKPSSLSSLPFCHLRPKTWSPPVTKSKMQLAPTPTGSLPPIPRLCLKLLREL